MRLLVRADDMGAAQAFNSACIEAFQSGLVRSVEVIVPGQWFPDAVRRIEETRGLDVGVHLTLTSEWDRAKWRPLTHAPSLVDADGYFHPTTRAFADARPKLDEVERELRAQIETARRRLGARVTHVSTHMGAATATPELRALTAKLAAEYRLGTDDAGGRLKPAGSIGTNTLTSDQREKALLGLLERLEPGDWLLVTHPGFDSPETRALGHLGYENVATDRSNVRRALVSERAKKVLERRGITLIGYPDLAD